MQQSMTLAPSPVYSSEAGPVIMQGSLHVVLKCSDKEILHWVTVKSRQVDLGAWGTPINWACCWYRDSRCSVVDLTLEALEALSSRELVRYLFTASWV